jgi:hypothetical protein
MTQDEKRIKIADACGILIEAYRMEDGSINTAALPDYFNDINACREMQSVFIGNASGAMTYAMTLLRVCGLDVKSEYDELNVDYCWHACNATAAQRAEAFGRTLNLW